MKKSICFTSLVLFFLLFPLFLNAQLITPADTDRYTAYLKGEEAIGRWDLTLEKSNGQEAPSWLEISKSGNSALVGQFVGEGGSARPISEIKYDSNTQEYSFKIPPQWGGEYNRLTFTLKGDQLEGVYYSGDKEVAKWKGERAPKLQPRTNLEWGSPQDLLEQGLEDWTDTDGWEIVDGVLKIATEGSENDRGNGGQNIRTKDLFEDFKLHVEFRYGEGANSGLYLRGRYELQILDSYGMQPESHGLGGIYGFVSPTKNMAKKPGEWQSLDVTLIGRFITVELNGEVIINNRPIPGITGGAIDSREAAPGPIMIQGDHYGLLEFRHMSITPAKN